MRSFALPLALMLSMAATACDDENRLRPDVGGDDLPDVETPDLGDQDDLGLDAEVDEGVQPDGAIDDAGPDAADAAIDDFAMPDFGPPMDEECNGEDDDFDGQIDEGVSNICGGCGGLPPEGCQVWRINLVQDPDGTLLPFRTVGLQAQVQARSTREIVGAECEVLRLAESPSPDAHLGVVDIDGALAELHLIPSFDANRNTIVYDNSPELGRTALYPGDDEIEIRTGGGLLVGPLNLTFDSPAPLDGIGEAELTPFAAAARAEGDGPLALTWTPARARRDMATRLFIGGSLPVFGPTRLYRGIEFYQLDARLRDDGDFELGAGIFSGGLAQSSLWVYALREVVRRVPIGQHAVEVLAGQRSEVRQAGAGEPPADAEPPFEIIAPDPNMPLFVPGEPLPIQWGPLPDGAGPLEVALSYRDPLAGEAVQINCEIADPASGEVTIPAEFTEGLTPDEFAQISIRWGLSEASLPPPDRGTFTRAVSMLLRLDR